MAAPPLVGVLNSSDDTVELLRFVLEEQGFVVLSAHIDNLKRMAGELDKFARQGPAVVVIDIAPPYDRNWRFFEFLRAHEGFARTRWVVTSTNPRRVHEAADVGSEVIHEVIGKPYDIKEIVDAVAEKLRGGSTER